MPTATARHWHPATNSMPATSSRPARTAVPACTCGMARLRLGRGRRPRPGRIAFDIDDQIGRIDFLLHRGVLSFVSGQIATTDPDAMALKTPLALIAVRGTTGVLDLRPDGQLTVLLAPSDRGTTGELIVRPLLDGTPLDSPAVLNVPFQEVTAFAGGNIGPTQICRANNSSRNSAHWCNKPKSWRPKLHRNPRFWTRSSRSPRGRDRRRPTHDGFAVCTGEPTAARCQTAAASR